MWPVAVSDDKQSVTWESTLVVLEVTKEEKDGSIEGTASYLPRVNIGYSQPIGRSGMEFRSCKESQLDV